MLALVDAVIGAFLAALRPRASLVAENLALRQQLATLRRRTPRPRLGPIDRAFWATLSRTWSRWWKRSRSWAAARSRPKRSDLRGLVRVSGGQGRIRTRRFPKIVPSKNVHGSILQLVGDQFLTMNR